MPIAKILLADDYGILRQALKTALDSENHIVTEAKNGKEAVALIDNDSFDILIIDVLMPEKNGIEVLNHIVEKNIKANVILITGGQIHIPTLKNQLEEDIEEISKNPNIKIKILYKPFKSEELFASINSMIEK